MFVVIEFIEIDNFKSFQHKFRIGPFEEVNVIEYVRNGFGGSHFLDALCFGLGCSLEQLCANSADELTHFVNGCTTSECQSIVQIGFATNTQNLSFKRILTCNGKNEFFINEKLISFDMYIERLQKINSKIHSILYTRDAFQNIARACCTSRLMDLFENSSQTKRIECDALSKQLDFVNSEFKFMSEKCKKIVKEKKKLENYRLEIVETIDLEDRKVKLSPLLNLKMAMDEWNPCTNKISKIEKELLILSLKHNYAQDRLKDDYKKYNDALEDFFNVDTSTDLNIDKTFFQFDDNFAESFENFTKYRNDVKLKILNDQKSQFLNFDIENGLKENFHSQNTFVSMAKISKIKEELSKIKIKNEQYINRNFDDPIDIIDLIDPMENCDIIKRKFQNWTVLSNGPDSETLQKLQNIENKQIYLLGADYEENPEISIPNSDHIIKHFKESISEDIGQLIRNEPIYHISEKARNSAAKYSIESISKHNICYDKRGTVTFGNFDFDADDKTLIKDFKKAMSSLTNDSDFCWKIRQTIKSFEPDFETNIRDLIEQGATIPPNERLLKLNRLYNDIQKIFGYLAEKHTIKEEYQRSLEEYTTIKLEKEADIIQILTEANNGTVWIPVKNETISDLLEDFSKICENVDFDYLKNIDEVELLSHKDASKLKCLLQEVDKNYIEIKEQFQKNISEKKLIHNELTQAKWNYDKASEEYERTINNLLENLSEKIKSILLQLYKSDAADAIVVPNRNHFDRFEVFVALPKYPKMMPIHALQSADRTIVYSAMLLAILEINSFPFIFIEFGSNIPLSIWEEFILYVSRNIKSQCFIVTNNRILCQTVDAVAGLTTGNDLKTNIYFCKLSDMLQ